jgi:hypothetical protein
MPKLCHYAHVNTFYSPSKFGTSMINCSPPAQFIFHPQILHANCATTPCAAMPKSSYYGPCHCPWCWCRKSNSWHQNLLLGQPPYLRTSHLNSTTTQRLGVSKLCLYACLNTFYCPSKFGTSMIHGSPPVVFSICKFRMPTASQRHMLPCRNFANLLILIPSIVHTNLEPVWSTVRPLRNLPSTNFVCQLRRNAIHWHAETLPICSC